MFFLEDEKKRSALSKQTYPCFPFPAVIVFSAPHLRANNIFTQPRKLTTEGRGISCTNVSICHFTDFCGIDMFRAKVRSQQW